MMNKILRQKHLHDEYRFENFVPSARVKGVFGDRGAKVITLTRRSKKHVVGNAGIYSLVGMTRRPSGCGICLVAMREFIWSLRLDESSVGCANQ
jgi:hypothetical protein